MFCFFSEFELSEFAELCIAKFDVAELSELELAEFEEAKLKSENLELP